MSAARLALFAIASCGFVPYAAGTTLTLEAATAPFLVSDTGSYADETAAPVSLAAAFTTAPDFVVGLGAPRNGTGSVTLFSGTLFTGVGSLSRVAVYDTGSSRSAPGDTQAWVRGLGTSVAVAASEVEAASTLVAAGAPFTTVGIPATGTSGSSYSPPSAATACDSGFAGTNTPESDGDGGEAFLLRGAGDVFVFSPSSSASPVVVGESLRDVLGSRRGRAPLPASAFSVGAGVEGEMVFALLGTGAAFGHAVALAGSKLIAVGAPGASFYTTAGSCSHGSGAVVSYSLGQNATVFEEIIVLNGGGKGFGSLVSSSSVTSGGSTEDPALFTLAAGCGDENPAAAALRCGDTNAAAFFVRGSSAGGRWERVDVDESGAAGANAAFHIQAGDSGVGVVSPYALVGLSASGGSFTLLFAPRSPFYNGGGSVLKTYELSPHSSATGDASPLIARAVAVEMVAPLSPRSSLSHSQLAAECGAVAVGSSYTSPVFAQAVAGGDVFSAAAGSVILKQRTDEHALLSSSSSPNYSPYFGAVGNVSVAGDRNFGFGGSVAVAVADTMGGERGSVVVSVSPVAAIDGYTANAVEVQVFAPSTVTAGITSGQAIPSTSSPCTHGVGSFCVASASCGRLGECQLFASSISSSAAIADAGVCCELGCAAAAPRGSCQATSGECVCQAGLADAWTTATGSMIAVNASEDGGNVTSSSLPALCAACDGAAPSANASAAGSDGALTFSGPYLAWPGVPPTIPGAARSGAEYTTLFRCLPTSSVSFELSFPSLFVTCAPRQGAGGAALAASLAPEIAALAGGIAESSLRLSFPESCGDDGSSSNWNVTVTLLAVPANSTDTVDRNAVINADLAALYWAIATELKAPWPATGYCSAANAGSTLCHASVAGQPRYSLEPEPARGTARLGALGSALPSPGAVASATFNSSSVAAVFTDWLGLDPRVAAAAAAPHLLSAVVAEAAVFLVVNGGGGESFPFLASNFSADGVSTKLAPEAEAAVFGHILPAATLERDVDFVAVATAAETYLSSSSSSSSRRLSSLSPDRHDIRVLFRLGNGVANSLGDAAPYGAAAVNAATSADAVEGALSPFSFPDRPAKVPSTPSPPNGGSSEELPVWVLGTAAGAAAAGALALGAAIAFFFLGRRERLRAVSAGGAGGGSAMDDSASANVGLDGDDLCHAGRRAASRLGLAPPEQKGRAGSSTGKGGMLSRMGLGSRHQDSEEPSRSAPRSGSVSAQNRELRTAMFRLVSLNDDRSAGFDNPMLLSRTFSAGSTYDQEAEITRSHTCCASMRRVASADVASLLVLSCEELPPVSVPGVANAWARLRASGVSRAAVAVAAMVRAIPTERLIRVRRKGAQEAAAAAAETGRDNKLGPESRRSSFASFMDEEEALEAELECESDEGNPIANPPPFAAKEEEGTVVRKKKATISRKEKREAEAARRHLLHESSLLAAIDARHSAELSPLFASLAREAGAVGAATDSRTPCEELCGLAEAVATRAKENVCVAAAAAAAIGRHQRWTKSLEARNEQGIGTMLSAVVRSQLRTAWRARRASERLRYACEFERGNAEARGGVTGVPGISVSASRPASRPRSGVDSGSSDGSFVGNVLGAVGSTINAGSQMIGLDSHIAALLSAADEEKTTSARWRRSMTIDGEPGGNDDETASLDDNASVASASSVEIAGHLSGVMQAIDGLIASAGQSIFGGSTTMIDNFDAVAAARDGDAVAAAISELEQTLATAAEGEGASLATSAALCRTHAEELDRRRRAALPALEAASQTQQLQRSVRDLGRRFSRSVVAGAKDERSRFCVAIQREARRRGGSEEEEEEITRRGNDFESTAAEVCSLLSSLERGLEEERALITGDSDDARWSPRRREALASRLLSRRAAFVAAIEGALSEQRQEVAAAVRQHAGAIRATQRRRRRERMLATVIEGTSSNDGDQEINASADNVAGSSPADAGESPATAEIIEDTLRLLAEPAIADSVSTLPYCTWERRKLKSAVHARQRARALIALRSWMRRVLSRKGRRGHRETKKDGKERWGGGGGDGEGSSGRDKAAPIWSLRSAAKVILLSFSSPLPPCEGTLERDEHEADEAAAVAVHSLVNAVEACARLERVATLVDALEFDAEALRATGGGRDAKTWKSCAVMGDCLASSLEVTRDAIEATSLVSAIRAKTDALARRTREVTGGKRKANDILTRVLAKSAWRTTEKDSEKVVGSDYADKDEMQRKKKKQKKKQKRKINAKMKDFKEDDVCVETMSAMVE